MMHALLLVAAAFFFVAGAAIEVRPVVRFTMKRVEAVLAEDGQ